jgi:hypothetical protein
MWLRSSPLTGQKNINDIHLLVPRYWRGSGVRTSVPPRDHLLSSRLAMPQQSRWHSLWDHAPSMLQLYYVAERQNQVDLNNIPLTACSRTTVQVECALIPLVSIRLKSWDMPCRITHRTLPFVIIAIWPIFKHGSMWVSYPIVSDVPHVVECLGEWRKDW